MKIYNKMKNRKIKHNFSSLLKFELSEEVKKEITGIFLVAVSLILFLSFFHAAGQAGDFFQRAFIKLIGWGYFFLPLIFIVIGILMICKSSQKRAIKASLVGIILLLFSILGLIQVIFGRQAFGRQTIEGGGYIGELITHPIVNLLGQYATVIIFLSGVFVSLILIFDTSLKRIIQSFKVVFRMKNIFLRRQESVNSPNEIENEEGIEVNQPSLVEHSKTEIDDKIKINNLDSGKIEKSKRKSKLENLIKIEKIGQKDFKLPPLNLLNQESGKPAGGNLKANASIIKQTLRNFGIEVEMAEINVGPTVTQYTLRPAQGVKLNQITALQNDLSLALAAHPLRIEAPIPGRSLVGIEVPNKSIINVCLRNLLESSEVKREQGFIDFVLGRNVAGQPVIADLSKMPHLLIAGATGTGKSVCLNSIILNFLYRYTPNYFRLILLDPKRVEFPIYQGIPHLLTPPVVEVDKMFNTLKWAIAEMERRFRILSENNCRDIQQYHQKIVRMKKKEEVEEKMPYIVLIIDELADLMMAHGRDVEAVIVRLSQMARAVGIHLILATQRPSVKIITGLIKANITARISFKVASQIDSRTILDAAGSEKLLGRGDMLFLSPDISKPKRIQGCFTRTEEVKKVTDFLRSQSEPEYQEEITEDKRVNLPGFKDSKEIDENDELYQEAMKIVVETQKGSTSLLQRRLRIGYSRAARLLDLLEKNGVVGPANGPKPRRVLIKEKEINKNGFDL